MVMNSIDILNSKLLAPMDDEYPINLTFGKMGICIYFFYLSRWEEKEEYKQIAEKLLNEVINKLSNKKDISVEFGLAGIAIGISHLVKEKFVEGDINEILEDVDSHIFRMLAFLKDEDTGNTKFTLLHLLYYMYMRFTAQSSLYDKFLFQELIIKTVEMLHNNLQTDFFQEHFSFSIQNYYTPLYLYIVSKIYELNIYNDRIVRLLEEVIDLIRSTIPVLQTNRLYLLWGVLNIKPCLSNQKNEIDAHIRLLKENIDIEHIINVELKNQDIYINDGVSLVYLLLFIIQILFPDYSIAYHTQSFFHRINNSEAWNTLVNRNYYFNKHRGLFDGFPGASLVLNHIKKQIP